jgi:type I restriction enzyme M protein
MTPSNEPVEELALVGIPQIAEIAHVGRSAVGNWRKRHPDFPTPKVQAPSGALFDLKEVEDWLIEQGKISRRAPASARLWGMADATRGVWMGDEFARFSLAFLVYLEACARAGGERPPGLELPIPTIPAGDGWADLRRRQSFRGFVRAFADAARRIEAANPELQGLLDPGLDEHQSVADPLARRVAATLADAGEDHSARRALFDALTDEVLTTHRFEGAFSTPADVAGLVARLLDFEGGVILDPAVGEGRLLWQTAFELPLAAETLVGEARVLGIDINQDACRRSRSRFYVYGRRAEILNENALWADWDSWPKADVIVADPPINLDQWGVAELYVDPRWRFGSPPPQSANFAWLQLIAQQLQPEGRAAVLMSTGSLFKGGREGAIRQRMVEAGAVEAIIALPPRLRVDTSIPLALWLLRSPEAPSKPDQILFVDASEMADRGRSRFSLPESSIDKISEIVALWRETLQVSERDADLATSVRTAEVMAVDADLNPARYRKRPEVDLDDLEQQAQALRQSLQASFAAANRTYADLTAYLEERG